MEGDLQPLYLLLTDCYMYLLRKGKWLKELHAVDLFGNNAPLLKIGVTKYFYLGLKEVKYLIFKKPNCLCLK